MGKRRRIRKQNKPHFDVAAAAKNLKLGSEAGVEEFATDAQIRLLVKLGVRQSKASQMTKHQAHRLIDRIKNQQSSAREKSRKRAVKTVWQKATERVVD